MRASVLPATCLRPRSRCTARHRYARARSCSHVRHRCPPSPRIRRRLRSMHRHVAAARGDIANSDADRTCSMSCLLLLLPWGIPTWYGCHARGVLSDVLAPCVRRRVPQSSAEAEGFTHRTQCHGQTRRCSMLSSRPQALRIDGWCGRALTTPIGR